MNNNIDSIIKIENAFPKTISEIDKNISIAKETALKNLDILYNIDYKDRTFNNTVKYFDNICHQFSIISTPIQVLEMVSPEKEIRDKAQQVIIDISSFYVDNFTQNKRIYNAFKELVNTNNISQLNQEESYTLKEYMDAFKRSGFELEEDIQQQIKILLKKLAEHELKFDSNIANANNKIYVTKSDLKGLDDNFIAQLDITEDNKYILGVDYPTYTNVMENCSIESTRKALWHEFENRAHPQNEIELNNVVNLRDQLAKLLGFDSYSNLDISNQMAHDTKTVDKFISNLIQKAKIKAKQELEIFSKELPDNISLTEDNLLNPWDTAYVKNMYKKKHLQIDERKISEYFPLDSTIKAILDIYEKFFGLSFNKFKSNNLWHQDVEILEVKKNNKFIGYILLDLFPRPNKYSHACEITIDPTFEQDENFHPALILVICNFTKPSKDVPSLLKRDEVKTFFHEFGHAIHAILGTTELSGNSGVNVKIDFAEMPSQMLEEWLYQPEYLKQISNHYISHEKLPNELIKKILDSKNFDSGMVVLRQLYFASISLDIYKSGENKNIPELCKKLFKNINNFSAYNSSSHTYSSFGHLAGYGAKYYGYMWSKVFALDIFETIKNNKFSPEIGQRYIDTVIGKGGSDDPQNLLYNFLERAPSEQAFFKDLGI